jgi:hypothetical protein
MSQSPNESYVQVPPDSTGKKMRTIQTTLSNFSADTSNGVVISQNIVQEQIVRIANDDGVIIDPRDVGRGNSLFDYGQNGWSIGGGYSMISKLLNTPLQNEAIYWANGW